LADGTEGVHSTQVQDNKVHFDFTENWNLQKGENLFRIYGNSPGNWCNGETSLSTYLAKPEDLVLVDDVTGYQLPVENSLFNGENGNKYTTKIDRKFMVDHFGAQTTANIGQQNVLCFDFAVYNELREDVIFDHPHMAIRIDNISSASGLINWSVDPPQPNITNIRAVVSGQEIVMSPQIQVTGNDLEHTSAMLMEWAVPSCSDAINMPFDGSVYFDIANNPALVGSKIQCFMYWPDGNTGSVTYNNGTMVPDNLISPEGSQNDGPWMGGTPIEIQQ
jgi:hypothetical protein